MDEWQPQETSPEEILNIKTGLENNNVKPLWRYIKGQRNDNIGVSPLKENGQVHSESKVKAGILLRQFSSVFTRTVSRVMPRVSLRVRGSISDIKVDDKGVENLLKKIQPHKAPGPDDIPNMVLKQCAKNLAPAVTLLFQKSLDSGTLPTMSLQYLKRATANYICIDRCP